MDLKLLLVITLAIYAQNGISAVEDYEDNLNASEQPEVMEPVFNVVKGVFINEVFGVTTYDSTIPLNFMVDLPILYPSMNMTHECSGDLLYCEMLYKARNMSQLIIDQLISEHPYLQSNVPRGILRNRRGKLNFMGDFFQWLYGQATTKDTDRLTLGIEAINNRQSEMEDQLVINQKYLVGVIRNLSSYHNQANEVFEDRFEKIRTMITDTAGTASRNEAVLAEIAALSMQDQYYLSLSTNLEATATECRNHLIPRSFISSKVLNRQATILRAQVFGHGYDLAIDVPQVWKHAIAECFFTPGNLAVTIHFPIKTKNISYKVFEVVRIPFQNGKSQCTLTGESNYLIMDSKNRTIQLNRKMEQGCKIEEQKFCFVPKYETNPELSKCAIAIFSSNPGSIAKECVFSCVQSDKVRMHQVTPGEIAITGAKTIVFTCSKNSNSTEKRRYNVDSGVGAVLMRIPCHCFAELDDNPEPLRPPYPCFLKNNIATESIKIIIPTQFSKLQSMVFSENPNDYKNLSEIYDFKWNEKIPNLVLDFPVPIHLSPKYVLDKILYGQESTSYLVYFWLIIITLVVLILCAVQCFTGATGFSPLKMASFLIMIPGVTAQDQSPAGIMDLILNLLKAFEIGNLIISIIGGVMALIMFYIVFKTFKFARGTYNLTRGLCAETGMTRR